LARDAMFIPHSVVPYERLSEGRILPYSFQNLKKINFIRNYNW